jgi:hypothetical protein
MGHLLQRDVDSSRIPSPNPAIEERAEETSMNEDAAPNTRDKVVRLIDYRENCPDCGVSVGGEHDVDPYDGGCDKAICLVTGRQRLMCDLDHDHGRDRWTGWPPGMTECE